MPIKWPLGRGQRAEKSEDLQKYVEILIKPLLNRPDELHITKVDGEGTTTYQLSVADEDRGRVIGKQGRTAKAIRTILAAASSRTGGKKALLEIID